MVSGTDDNRPDNADDIDDSEFPEPRSPRRYDPTPNYTRERLREFARSAPGEESEPEKLSGGSSARLIKIFIFIVLIALGGGGYWYYSGQQWSLGPDAGPPLVIAEDTPVRVKPDDPGGLDVPHQDKLVYGRLDPNGAPRETVERLLPPPEVTDSTVRSAGSVERETAQIAGEMPEQIKAPPLPKAPDVADIPVPELPAATPDSLSAAAGRETPKQEAAPPPPQPAGDTAKAASPPSPPTPSSPGSSTAEKPKEKTRAVVAGPSFFRVQLGSFRSADSAKNGWSVLSKKYSDMLSGLKHEIVRADLGARGIYYRLQAGAFKKSAGASEICRRLSAKGQGCLVVRR